MDPDAPAVKPEPGSPAESGDEADGGETFFSVKTESPSLDPAIKTEIAFPDLPIEFEPKIGGEGRFEFTHREINVKVENDAYLPKKGNPTIPHFPSVKLEPGGVSESSCFQHIALGHSSATLEEHRRKSTNISTARLRAVKPEPRSPAGSADEAAGGGASCTDIDVAYSDIKIESAKFASSYSDRNTVLQDSSWENSTLPPISPGREPQSGTASTVIVKQTPPGCTLSSTREKQFSCTQCTYTSYHKGHLKGHMLIHTGEKPFSCSECAYTCIRKGSLSIHMLTHTGEKPFSCSECSYTCNIKSSLRRHALTHSGEKPFSCSECPYTCNVISSLRRHTLIHSGKKPFSCTECDYKCTTKGNLRIHMVKHTRSR